MARGVTCEREIGLPTSDPPGTASRSTKESTSEQEVLARLTRVEALLTRLDARVSPTSYSPDTSPIATALTTPQTLQQVFQRPSDAEAAHKADSHLLEQIGTRDHSLLLSLAVPPRFRICTIADFAAISHQPDQHTSTITLPTRSEARALLAVYQEHIEYMHHVTYSPRTVAALDEAYDAIETGGKPRLGVIALLTSIFASSAAFQAAVGDKRDLLGITRSDAEKVCHAWAYTTFTCLDPSTRMGLYSLEDLQALVTIFFLMYNLEGFSARTRTGMGLAIGIARDLGLHRLDYPAMVQHKLLDPGDKVDVEIKRRVWWHIAASDWQLGVSGGPQEGTYSIQPRQIATNFPRHVEEEDLQTQSPTFERPLSVPTASSYLIQRIRLAEICRKTVDAVPLGAWGSDSVRYDDIVALDHEFERFHRELPSFFRDTPEARTRFRELYQRRPAILVQKYTVNIIFQNRRCRLHQPYLVRGFSDKAYARSRDVCLQSARAVMAISLQLDQEDAPGASLLSLSGVHHHMFFAAVAMVMDLCFNRTDGDERQEAARRAEVMEACRMLEKAKDRSPVAKRFLESLMDVMRKHKIRLFDTSAAEEAAPAPAAAACMQSVHPTVLPDFDPEMSAGQSDFEQIWQSYIENGPNNMDVPEWTELFDDLQTQLT